MYPGILGFNTSVMASLQSTLATQSNIVQLGIVRCSKPGGCGGEPKTDVAKVPDEGQLHFFFTKYDNGGGRIFLADDWYGAAPHRNVSQRNDADLHA